MNTRIEYTFFVLGFAAGLVLVTEARKALTR